LLVASAMSMGTTKGLEILAENGFDHSRRFEKSASAFVAEFVASALVIVDVSANAIKETRDIQLVKVMGSLPSIYANVSSGKSSEKAFIEGMTLIIDGLMELSEEL